MDEARNGLLERLRQGPRGGDAGVGDGETARLRAAWDALAEPPAGGVPPGFAARVAALATAERASDTALWPSAPMPGWVRGVAVLALLGGIALGGGVGLLGSGAAGWSGSSAASASQGGFGTGDATLAEGYLAAIGGDDADAATLGVAAGAAASDGGALR